MGKLFSLLLGAAVLFGVAWYTLTGRSGDDGVSQPKGQLEQVREKTKAIELEAQEQVDRTLKVAEPSE